MTLFLLTFFLIYGGLHSYILMKAWRALHLHGPAGAIAVFVFLFMTVAPVIIRLLEKTGHEAAGRCVAYVGYSWMGFIFILFSFSVVFEIIRLVCFVYERVFTRPGVFETGFAAPLFFVLPLLFAVVISGWAHWEANKIRVRTLEITTDKLPRTVKQFTIVQITDVHAGLMVRETKLRQIAKLVADAKPDILVSTGDLVDGDMNTLNGLADILGNLKTPLGKFAVTGNHEYYAGIDNALSFTRRAGFTVLRGAGVTIADTINISGVDDIAGVRSGRGSDPEAPMLSKLPGHLFTVLLKHRPVVDSEAEAARLFDLQLSGHTHKGQIYPFNYLVWLSNRLYTGYHVLPHGCRLYTGNGTGTWGPPMRLFAPPEITVVRLHHS